MLTFLTFQCVAESRPSEENVAVDNVDTVSSFLQSRFASNLRHIDPGQHIGFDQVALRISAVEYQGVIVGMAQLDTRDVWIPLDRSICILCLFVGRREISTGHFKSATHHQVD